MLEITSLNDIVFAYLQTSIPEEDAFEILTGETDQSPDSEASDTSNRWPSTLSELAQNLGAKQALAL